MKIKHWQGYGSVNAKLISKTKDQLVIKVWGMHEWGLETDDKYRVFEWLVKRFDKTRKDYMEIESVRTDDDYERDGGVDVEVCIYTINFRPEGRFGLYESQKITLTIGQLRRLIKESASREEIFKIMAYLKEPTQVVGTGKFEYLSSGARYGSRLVDSILLDVLKETKGGNTIISIRVSDSNDELAGWPKPGEIVAQYNSSYFERFGETLTPDLICFAYCRGPIRSGVILDVDGNRVDREFERHPIDA